jgi:Zn-dependent M28 family amino/carboxypeptidase
MAADFIARQLETSGLEPAFESGYLQPVPLARVREREGGRGRVVLLRDESAAEDGTVAERIQDVNVAGILRGQDPERAGEAVIVGAHFDHVGIRPPPPGSSAEAEGDSIFNGADDDASGVVAVLETARSLAAGDPLDRTVIFLLTTGEEMGLLGTRWYIENPAIPLEHTVADLQVEMIGRPDSLAGGVGRAWLTGFERTTLGERLAAEGVPLVPDPRPQMRFFFRSDNIAFAHRGIPAHTLSSYGLHQDYHTPDDEADRLDYEHMASVIESLIWAVEILATGEPPVWKEGGRPAPPPGG